MSAAEVEETLQRIQSHKGVQGVVIANADGKVIRSTIQDTTTTNKYAALMTQLVSKAFSAVRDLDVSDNLTFMRIRSKEHEIMVAPHKDFVLIVIQQPTTN